MADDGSITVADDTVFVMGCINEKAGKVDKETCESEFEKVGGSEEYGDRTKCALESATVSAGEVENGCGKETAFAELSEINGHTDVEKQEKEGGREKRQRRRGSRKKSDAQNRFKGSEDYVMTEARSKRHGDEAKRAYSREEMEALRFVDLEAQNKKWVEVYCGLSPAVVKDYDGLANSNQQKKIQIDFDPRKQFQNVETNPGVHGEDPDQAIDNETGNVNPSDPEYNYSEEDDSDDDCNSILRPAFFVSGEPKFDSGPPQDGFEYLRRVRIS